MFRSFFLLTSLFQFGLLSAATAQPPRYSGFQLRWADDFDQNALNTSRWTPQFSLDPTNFSLHAYLPENVHVADGNLVITSQNNPFGDLPYRSGQVISVDAMRYGRFDVRGNLPTSRGMWPAIWLLPDAPWPSQGEIDIMENRGDSPYLTSSAFHWGTNPPFSHDFVFGEYQSTFNGEFVNYHEGFHVYSAEWDPDQIRFYVDGAHYYSVRNSSVGNFLSEVQTAPMRLIINTAVGGTFLDNPDDSTVWPQTFEVDYVHVYNRVREPYLSVANNGFDFDQGSLAEWSLFGNNGSNVSVDQSHSNSGQGALKLFGQFNGLENYSGVEQGASVKAGDLLTISADTFIDSLDSISGTENELILTVDFYAKPYSAFGDEYYLQSQGRVIANGASPNDFWRTEQFLAIVPENAVEARVAVVFRQIGFARGAVFVDNVSLLNADESQMTQASEFSVAEGIYRAGGTPDLTLSDDKIVQVQARNFSDSPVQLTYTTISDLVESDSLCVQVESRSNTVGLNLSLEILNQTTGDFEFVGAASESTNDTVKEFEFSMENTDYIDQATGRTTVRTSWSMAGPVLFFPWSIEVDQIQFEFKR